MTAAVPLLLLGAGGHAAAVIDVIESEGRFAVAGLVGSAGEEGRRLLGYPVLGTDDDLPGLLVRYGNALIAVGHIKTAAPRIRLFERLQGLGCTPPTVVSPRAHVSRHATLGAGTVVMHGAIVNAGAAVGRNCIINSQALVEHDAVVGDHCHISTAAAINGGVRIGTGCFVGSHATVRESVVVGDGSIIGMGELLRADCAPGATTPRRGRRP